MAKRHVLFLHRGKKLPELLEKELSKLSSWVVDFEHFGGPAKPFYNHRYNLVILESRKSGIEALQQEQIRHFAVGKCPILAVPTGMLKKNSRRILEAVQAFLEDIERPVHACAKMTYRTHSQNPVVDDFVNGTLKEFVKKMKPGYPQNLYAQVMKEIERPLINFTLIEAKGNQSKAALMLGMNRNTLRKKIKLHKIHFQQS